MKFFYFLLVMSITLQVKAQTFYDNAPCTTNQTPSSYTFDWKAQSFTYYKVNDPNPKSIQSPFHLSSLTNQNVNQFSLYSNKDYHETDGWNLIKSDFGTPTGGVVAPYFVLYNRHSGTLRFFIAITELLGQNNAAVVTLSYASGMRTAHLEHYNQNDVFNSLEDYNNKVAAVQVPNYFVNQANYWFHADFNMNYDPCACNFENRLRFEVHLTQTSTLTFEIEGQALQNYNLGEFTDNFGRVGEKGAHSSSKGLSNFPPFTMFKNLESGVNYASALYDALWNNTPQDKKNGLLNFFAGITGLAKAANGVEALLGFITGSSVSNAPQVPLALDIKLKGQGNISTSFPYTFFELVTPNSYQVPVASAYLPEYNNGYGIFNLLTTPTITRTYAYYDVYDDWYEIDPIYTRATSLFKLSNPLKYIVNPNAGFDLANSDLKASLVFKGFFGDGVNMQERTMETNLYPFGCLTDLEVPFDEIRDFYSSPAYVEGWTPSGVQIKIYARFRISGTNKDIYYVNTFKTNLNYIYDYNYENAAFPEAFPASNCSAVNAPATDAEIKAVCNTTKYKNKAKEFFRAGNSTETTELAEKSQLPKIIVRNNPVVNNKLSLSIQDDQAATYDIEFYDVSGRLLRKVKKQSASSGTTDVEVDLSGVHSHGLGLLKISDGKTNQTFKILY